MGFISRLFPLCFVDNQGTGHSEDKPREQKEQEAESVLRFRIPLLTPLWASRQIDGWLVGGFIAAAFIFAPIIALGGLALAPTESIWPHLWQTVLPGQIIRTLILMGGVAGLAMLLGIYPAWCVTFYDFPARRQLAWLLFLPLAVPTYIAAYAYTGLFDRASPFYTHWQSLFGAQAPYPDLHNMGGAIFIMSAVLYPYIYLAARTAFIQQSAMLIEAGRTLGAKPYRCFWRIALPMSRPAIIAGTALAVMECINDIGAVEHLGVYTLVIGVYDTWLSRGSLAGAAQIALVLLCFMGFLLLLERFMRAAQAHYDIRTSGRRLSRFQLSQTAKIVTLAICALPVLLGFILPASILGFYAIQNFPQASTFLPPALNSLMLALLAAVTTTAIGLFLAYGARTHRTNLLAHVARTAALGYALPGTVLGLAILICLTFADTYLLGGGAQATFYVSGTLIGLVLAYNMRFLALSYGTIEAGLHRIPQVTDMAARSLGSKRGATLWRVHIPLLRPVLLAAFVLVFVDSMKELPATLILRPFNFETLATQAYNFASLGQIEDAALPALLIIATSALPLFIALQIIRRRILSHYSPTTEE